MPRRFTDHQRTIARQILTLLRAHPLGLTKQDMCTRAHVLFGEAQGMGTQQREDLSCDGALVVCKTSWHGSFPVLEVVREVSLAAPGPQDA